MGLLNRIIIDKKSDDKLLWKITNADDWHNCVAKPLNGVDGDWVICMDPSCEDNEINTVGFVDLNVKDLIKTCDACPSAWSGRLFGGKRLYVKYRYGTLRVYVDDYLCHHEVLGGEFDGYLENEKLGEILNKLGFRFITEIVSDKTFLSDDMDDW